MPVQLPAKAADEVREEDEEEEEEDEEGGGRGRGGGYISQAPREEEVRTDVAKREAH